MSSCVQTAVLSNSLAGVRSLSQLFQQYTVCEHLLGILGQAIHVVLSMHCLGHSNYYSSHDCSNLTLEDCSSSIGLLEVTFHAVCCTPCATWTALSP